MRIHRHRQRQPTLNLAKYRTNERIKAETVRVIDENGVMLGEMETKKAIELAREKEMDLVEVSPKAQPPVSKILDYGQFKYHKEKEARKQKAQQKEVELKSVRLSVRIGLHDFEVRLSQAKKFLTKGSKVKIELPMRGREKAHRDVATEVIDRFVNALKAEFEIKLEQPVKYQGGRLSVIVVKS